MLHRIPSPIVWARSIQQRFPFCTEHLGNCDHKRDQKSFATDAATCDWTEKWYIARKQFREAPRMQTIEVMTRVEHFLEQIRCAKSREVKLTIKSLRFWMFFGISCSLIYIGEEPHRDYEQQVWRTCRHETKGKQHRTAFRGGGSCVEGQACPDLEDSRVCSNYCFLP